MARSESSILAVVNWESQGTHQGGVFEDTQLKLAVAQHQIGPEKSS